MDPSQASLCLCVVNCNLVHHYPCPRLWSELLVHSNQPYASQSQSPVEHHVCLEYIPGVHTPRAPYIMALFGTKKICASASDYLCKHSIMKCKWNKAYAVDINGDSTVVISRPPDIIGPEVIDINFVKRITYFEHA